MRRKIQLNDPPSGLVTSVDLSMGNGAAYCYFSMDMEDGTIRDFYLNSSDAGPQGAGGVLDRFYGMALIVLAAFQNQFPLAVLPSSKAQKDSHELAVSVILKMASLTTDDPMMLAFVGRVATSISINGEGNNSRQCEISFSPDDSRNGDCDPRTWNVNEPFSLSAPGLIAAVASQGRVNMHRADAYNAQVSDSDGMTISIWAPGTAKKRRMATGKR
jgi:hypothetical protein